MEKREKDILKEIEEKTKDIKVPEALEPANIESLIKEQELKGRKKRRRIYQMGSLIAACLVLVIGLGVWTGNRAEEAAKNDAESASGYEEKADSKSASEEDVSEEDASKDNAFEGDASEKDTYEKVYAYIRETIDSEEKEIGFLDRFSMGSTGSTGKKTMENSTSADMAVAESVAEDTGGGYSETNTRQAGVDEGDTVKTDGRYLYVLKENEQQISIVDTKSGLKEVGKIQAGKDFRVREFYLLTEEKRVVCVGSVMDAEETEENVEEDNVKQGEVSEEDIMYLEEEISFDTGKVRAVTYDVKNPEKPKKQGSVSQSGYYTSSRVADGYLYLFSEYSIGGNVDKDEPRTFIPMVNDGLIAEDKILLPPFENGYMYEVVTAVDLDEPSKVADSRAIFTNGGELYVSNENIYYYETRWDDNGDSAKTVIRKIGYNNGKFKKAVKGSIKGYIEDSFSIDEYEGNLRIAATVGDTNSVYVLDGKLKKIGSINGLAKDERIYSARFLGDTGYFVTFRETDPLFSVDLSDPEKPEIIGKLKIPGFSDYLHFYGENKLLGIGMNVDADSQVTDGVKLSMFDISDKTDVKEENTLVLKNVYSTEVSYDYKAALIDADRNMIGFAGNEEGGDRYYLFSYDAKKGFECHLSEEINGNSVRGARGVYIKKTLYVVRGNVIEAYSLTDYKKVDDLIL